jgi:Surface antigen variable number repeat
MTLARATLLALAVLVAPLALSAEVRASANLPILDLRHVIDVETAGVLRRDSNIEPLVGENAGSSLPPGISPSEFIEIERERVLKTLTSRGYIDATVSVDGGGRIVPYPGARYRIGSVAVHGVAGIGDNTNLARGLAGLQKNFAGKTARGDVLAELLSGIAQLPKRFGFAFSSIVAHQIVRDEIPGLVRVEITLDTGRQYDFGAVSFTGLRTANSKELKSYLTFSPGDMFNQQLLDDVWSKLQKSGRFDRIRVDYGDRVDALGQLPIVIDLTERPMLSDELIQKSFPSVVFLLSALVLLVIRQMIFAFRPPSYVGLAVSALALTAAIAAAAIVFLRTGQLLGLPWTVISWPL